MDGQFIKEMHGRIVKNFMDILIMAELRNSPMSGFDVISFIHKKFRLLVSSGTVYSHLYALERDDFIKGNFNNRKRVYALTEKGEKTFRQFTRQVVRFKLSCQISSKDAIVMQKL